MSCLLLLQAFLLIFPIWELLCLPSLSLSWKHRFPLRTATMLIYIAGLFSHMTHCPEAELLLLLFLQMLQRLIHREEREKRRMRRRQEEIYIADFNYRHTYMASLSLFCLYISHRPVTSRVSSRHYFQQHIYISSSLFSPRHIYMMIHIPTEISLHIPISLRAVCLPSYT